MSFAAAICSIVSEGIVPMRAWLFLPRSVSEAMPNLRSANQCPTRETVVGNSVFRLASDSNGGNARAHRQRQRGCRGVAWRRRDLFARAFATRSTTSLDRRSVGDYLRREHVR